MTKGVGDAGCFFFSFCQDVFEDEEEVKSVTKWGVSTSETLKVVGKISSFFLLLLLFVWF